MNASLFISKRCQRHHAHIFVMRRSGLCSYRDFNVGIGLPRSWYANTCAALHVQILFVRHAIAIREGQ